jgi:two-component system chemotaxis response regulator CheY
MRILIVDDSRAMRMLLKRALRQSGVELDNIEEAQDGREALTKVREFTPGLVLSDWNMPEMTGIEFLQTLRDSGDTTPFVFVTSQVSEEMRHQARVSGAQLFVTKPFTADTFTEVFAAL